MRIYQTPAFVEQLWQKYLWKVCTEEHQKSLFLTFDDGPIPVLTEYVLDTLQEFEAKATFFCVGDNVRKHPEIFQRISSEGHQTGNHTYHHLNSYNTKTADYLKDIQECEKVLAQNHLTLPQKSPTLPLFRPPYGRLRQRAANILHSQYQIVMWSVLTYDFDQNLRPEVCYQKAKAATQDGAIIVFHDNWKAERNLRYTLPRYLAHFAQKGYKFKTL